MNDKQIETLLERMKQRPSLQMDRCSEDSILAGLHCGIRKHRRNTFAVSICLLLLLAGVFIGKGLTNNNVRKNAEEQLENRAMLVEFQNLFPETGVALVNGNVITFEHDDIPTEKKHLGICISRINGEVPITFDAIVADDDYISLKDGLITGDILVNRCSEQEVIIDIDLVFSSPNGKRQNVRKTVLLCSVGNGLAKGSAADDYLLECCMDTLNRG